MHALVPNAIPMPAIASSSSAHRLRFRGVGVRRHLQRVMATFDGWVNSVHYSITAKVGDMGAVFAADRCAPHPPWPLLAPLFVFTDDNVLFAEL
jgi:hypothetical protein